MQSNSQRASEFYKTVNETGIVLTLKDEGGFIAPKATDGARAMPFWSSAELLASVQSSSDEYANFVTHEISLDEFMSRWLPGLEKDNLLVGLNWSSEKATGYDVEPMEVKKMIESVGPTKNLS